LDKTREISIGVRTGRHASLWYWDALTQQRHRFADAEWGRFRAMEDLVGGCKLLHRAIIQNRIFNNLYYSETPQLGF
jgi:hypothetical protein